MSEQKNNNPQNNNEDFITEEQCKSICKNFMNEYIAEKQEEIQSATIEACKSDIDRLIDEKIKELTLPSNPPQEGNGNGGSEKDLTEILSEFKDEIKEELGKNIFSEEDFKKGLADFIKGERNPQPTPTPQQGNTNEGDAAKTFTAEEIFKNIQAQNKSNSLFNKLGANMED